MAIKEHYGEHIGIYFSLPDFTLHRDVQTRLIANGRLLTYHLVFIVSGLGGRTKFECVSVCCLLQVLGASEFQINVCGSCSNVTGDSLGGGVVSQLLKRGTVT